MIQTIIDLLAREYRPLSHHHHYRFVWDRNTGYSHDMVYYGPFDCSSSCWIVPNTIEENEYDIEPELRPVSVLHHFRQPGGER